jgi:hypothetical protein
VPASIATERVPALALGIDGVDASGAAVGVCGALGCCALFVSRGALEHVEKSNASSAIARRGAQT